MMTLPTRISYGIMAALLVLIGWLHLGTLVLTAMFGYFALRLLSFNKSKALGVVLYMVLVIAMGYGLFFSTKRVYQKLPEIADRTIMAVVDYAEAHDIELPFSDYASAKTLARTKVKEKFDSAGEYLGAAVFIRTAAFQVAMLVIGLVVAVSLFLSARWGTEEDLKSSPDSLYATVVRELTLRFRTFFFSFSKVIGAQIVISVINTGLTAIFLLLNNFHYAPVLVVLTFICGVLPIIGNVISNTLIVGVAFSMSPRMAIISLIFLVVIHKLEYFLNSKIVGDRIKNPMWLTLLGIVLGEKLMGVPGIILAPVVLHYIKVEASKNKVTSRGVEATGAKD